MNYKYIQNYSDNSDASEVTFLIYSEIGAYGVAGSDFAKELAEFDAMDQIKTIHLRICSPGGSVVDGMKIIMAILNCKKNVITYNDGLAASIASLIFLCGDITMMWDSALLMFHNCSGGNAEVLDKFNTALNTLYQKRLNRSADEVKAWMDAESYFLADEAKQLGLVDNVFETALKVKYSEVELKPENATTLYNLYVTNLATFEGNTELEIKNKSDEMIENKVKELLNLDTEMTAENVVVEIENLATKANAVAELETVKASLEDQVNNYLNEINEVKNKLVEKENEITNLSAIVDQKEEMVIELQNKVNEYQSEEMKRQDEKVNSLVETALENKKITATEKEDWLAIAKTDYTRAEKLINGLRPVRNKLSEQLEQQPVINLDPFTTKLNEIKRKTGQK